MGSLVGGGGLGLMGCRPQPASAIPPAAAEQPLALSGEDDDFGEPEPSVSAEPRERWAELAGFCDGVVAPDDAERQGHCERMRAALHDAGLDALVAEAGPTMQHLTGVRWGRSERPFLLVLPRTGPITWLVPAFEQRTAAVQLGDEAVVVAWQEHQSPYTTLADALRSAGLRGRIAVEPALRSFIVEGLRGAVGSRKVVSGAAVVDAVRMRKQPAELARLRRANEATKAALRLVSERSIEPGMRQSELAAIVREAQRAAGLRDVWVLALFGPNASFPHGTPEDRALAPGDAVLVDTGGSLHGYQSDITRTWVLGEPGTALQKAWDTVARAQRAALATIRPGVRCGDVDAAARAVIDEAGFGPDYRHFTHRLGHGIGRQVHEAPYLVRDSQRVLEPGMTMSNEPGIYIPEGFGVRIEDIVAVTDDGAEVFGPPVDTLRSL